MMCYDDSFLFKIKNLLLYNKLPQNSADSNSCFILKVRDSGRAQLGGLSLICMLSVEVVGAGGSASQIAFSLLHLVPGLGWLTVGAGSERMLNHPRPNSYWGSAGLSHGPGLGTAPPSRSTRSPAQWALPSPGLLRWDLRTRWGEVTGSEEALRPLPPTQPCHLLCVCVCVCVWPD